MTEFDLYLVTRMDSLRCLFVGITVVLVIGFIVFLIVMGMWYESLGGNAELIEIWKKIRKYIFISVAVLVFSVLGNVITPSTKEMIAILFVPKIVNNESVQGIGEDGLKLIRVKLDQWTNDVLEKATEKVVEKVTK